MKIILISILSITLSVSLFARLNPFEPTDLFLEEKALILKNQIQDDEKFKVLPFVQVQVLNDMLTITVDTKYKLLKKDLLIPETKIVFDFEGDISFYTIRKDIINDDFNSFTVGTHREDNFFRVVIDLPTVKTDYIETIDSKNAIITIKKK